jgi:hypothetical protein
LATEKVVEHFHLPSLGDMDSPRSIAETLKEFEESINTKGSLIRMIPKITKEILKEQIVGPSK